MIVEDVLPSKAVLLNITLKIVVSHVQFEFKTLFDINDAGVGTALGVDLAVEEFRCLDFGNHVTGTAVDRHVVARRQFVGSCFRNFQVRVLK